MSRHRCRSIPLRPGRAALIPLALALGACAAAPRAGTQGSQEYAFWPPMPDEPRIQFLRGYRYSSDVEPPPSAFDQIVFGSDREILPIGKPYGVAMWKGRIYVCDITNPGVVILDLLERETRLMGTRGVQPMAQPTDIAIAPDGMKYVVDRKRGRIYVFDEQDRHAAVFGERGFVPAGAAVHGRELYVPEFETQSILVLDRFTGERLRSIGEPGGGPGQFIRPLGVHVDDDGYVYATDAIRGRLQKFAPDGGLVYTLGEIADAPGNFVRPKHVAADPDGVVYVVDAAFQNVQMFNEAGELLMFFGGPGAFPGSMSLPAGLAVSDEDVELFADFIHPAFEAKRLVLVTNQFGLNKVSVYALGRLKPGRTVADIAPYAADVWTGEDAEPADPAAGGELPVGTAPSPAQGSGGDDGADDGGG